jgi:hypothetical protein
VPPIAALRFLAADPRGYNDIPATMIDVCRRRGIRRRAEWQMLTPIDACAPPKAD